MFFVFLGSSSVVEFVNMYHITYFKVLLAVMNGIKSLIFKFFYLLIVCAATSLVIQFHFGNTISWVKDLCKVCSCSFSDEFFAFSFAHIYAALAKQPKQKKNKDSWRFGARWNICISPLQILKQKLTFIIYLFSTSNLPRPQMVFN